MSTIKVGTLLAADGSTTTQPSIPALDKRMAKAWVNFNGTGTVAIRDDYGVSSITDIQAGQYVVNFTTSMADANYMVSATAGNNDSTYTETDSTDHGAHTGLRTTNGCRVFEFDHDTGGTGQDANYIGVLVFGS